MGCQQAKQEPSRSSPGVPSSTDALTEASPGIPCCSSSNSDRRIVVQLVHPETQVIQEITYRVRKNNKKQEECLLDIMNSLFFIEEKNQSIDVCFHSLYNKNDDRFHFYLSRLLNIEMENVSEPYLGRMWVLYIHNKPHDWDTVVNTQMKFNTANGGKLVWRYERIVLPPNSPPVKHELSQTNNLAYIDTICSGVSKSQNESFEVRSSHLIRSSRGIRRPSPAANDRKAKTYIETKESDLRSDMLGELRMLNSDANYLSSSSKAAAAAAAAAGTSAQLNQHYEQFLQVTQLTFSRGCLRKEGLGHQKLGSGSDRHIMFSMNESIHAPMPTERGGHGNEYFVDSKLNTIDTQPNEEFTLVPSILLNNVKESSIGIKSLPNSALFRV